MAWFSKRGKDDSEPPSDVVAVERDESLVAEGHTGRPVSRPLAPAEQARIEAASGRLEDLGVDVDDLQSIGAAYDTAFSGWQADQVSVDSGELVELFGIAIGEHLARHSAREWAVVTDVFGTDLGLVAARAETVIVPHNIVSARWMRRERGWIPLVVSHLVQLQTRER